VAICILVGLLVTILGAERVEPQTLPSCMSRADIEDAVETAIKNGSFRYNGITYIITKGN